MAPVPIVENRLKRKLARGELSLCFSIKAFSTIELAVIASSAGYDCVYLDLEHGSLGPEAASRLSIACLGLGLTPLVRVPDLDPAFIGRVLDWGAQGVIVPHVTSAEDAAAAVAACRFPPIGRRSAGPPNAHSGYRTVAGAEALAQLDEAVMVAVMIETKSGLENVEAIAAVPGIDLLFVGSNDLTLELGIAGEFRHPLLREAFSKVIAAGRRHGKAIGIGGIRNAPDLVGDLVAEGGRFISAGNDVGLMLSAGTAQVRELRQLESRVGA